MVGPNIHKTEDGEATTSRPEPHSYLLGEINKIYEFVNAGGVMRTTPHRRQQPT